MLTLPTKGGKPSFPHEGEKSDLAAHFTLALRPSTKRVIPPEFPITLNHNHHSDCGPNSHTTESTCETLTCHWLARASANNLHLRPETFSQDVIGTDDRKREAENVASDRLRHQLKDIQRHRLRP